MDGGGERDGVHRRIIVILHQVHELHRFKGDLSHLSLRALRIRLRVSPRLLLLRVLVNDLLQRPENFLKGKARDDKAARAAVRDAVRRARVRLQQRALTEVLVLSALREIR